MKALGTYAIFHQLQVSFQYLFEGISSSVISQIGLTCINGPRGGRVREEHAALDGVTLLPSDPFWTDFYSPMGGIAAAPWCRCESLSIRPQIMTRP